MEVSADAEERPVDDCIREELGRRLVVLTVLRGHRHTARGRRVAVASFPRGGLPSAEIRRRIGYDERPCGQSKQMYREVSSSPECT